MFANEHNKRTSQRNIDTFVVIGLWRAKAAWRALTPAQRTTWRRYWARCGVALFAPARLANGDLPWIEIEDGGEVWVLCELMPPDDSHSFVDLYEPLGMSDFLMPISWLTLELTLDELVFYWRQWIRVCQGAL